MRAGIAMLALLLMAGAQADDAELLNEATLRALDAAVESIMGAPKVGDDVRRVGVARLEGDTANATDLAKMVLSKTAFNVVLTDDADWAPLLDEFARQVRREDILLSETANELRVQGVDAVLYGTVEKAAVDRVLEEGKGGHRATVRLLLSLASLSETNPGGVLWSDQVTGTAEDLRDLSFARALVARITEDPALLAVVAGVVVLLVLAVAMRRAARPR